MVCLPYADRVVAGQRLAASLETYRDRANVLVLALPRGGVPVGLEVARRLRLELDVLVVRKIGLPDNPELALGAIAAGGTIAWNTDLLTAAGWSSSDLEDFADRERVELARRENAYRGGRSPLRLTGRTALLVDDGLATGATMLAAVRAVRKAGAARVVVAVPVGAQESLSRIARDADEVVCPLRPPRLRSIGEWYERFDQVEDDEVRRYLREADAAFFSSPRHERAVPRESASARIEVAIPAGEITLSGDLRRPPEALGIVVFAHGSGSSRTSSRNLAVAAALEREGLATLLFDLLTPAESARDERTREYRFDIPRLSQRLVHVVDYVESDPATADLPIGCFGASTGAAAALVAAAQRPHAVRAVVSRGGRPDLAGNALAAVRAPTLLLVGGLDQEVLELNRAAADRMFAPVTIEIVPNATHLFEEPGALDEVARFAIAHFRAHLGNRAPAAPDAARRPAHRRAED